MGCPWGNVSVCVHSEPEQLTTRMSFSLTLRAAHCRHSGAQADGSFTEKKTVTEREHMPWLFATSQQCPTVFCSHFITQSKTHGTLMLRGTFVSIRLVKQSPHFPS